MDLALEAKMGKGRVRGKNSHPTFLDWKLDGWEKFLGVGGEGKGPSKKNGGGPSLSKCDQL